MVRANLSIYKITIRNYIIIFIFAFDTRFRFETFNKQQILETINQTTESATQIKVTVNHIYAIKTKNASKYCLNIYVGFKSMPVFGCKLRSTQSRKVKKDHLLDNTTHAIKTRKCIHIYC